MLKILKKMKMLKLFMLMKMEMNFHQMKLQIIQKEIIQEEEVVMVMVMEEQPFQLL